MIGSERERVLETKVHYAIAGIYNRLGMQNEARREADQGRALEQAIAEQHGSTDPARTASSSDREMVR